MSRIIETKKLIDTFLKSEKIFYEVDSTEDMLIYTIEGGTFPLMMQFEFWNLKQELEFPDEYCLLQNWIPLSEYGDESVSFINSEISTIDDVISEVEQCLDFYKEKLKIINKVERKIKEIKDLLEDSEIEFDNTIDIKTFLF